MTEQQPRVSSASLALQKLSADQAWSSVGDRAGLARRTADQLARAIITGRLAGGARLGETEIGEAFNVSRTPVREALFILERDGLVERAHRKEARVSEVTAKQALDVYVCRAVLYGLSAKMAVSRFDESALTEVAELVQAMRDAAKTASTDTYFDLNVKFHDLVGSWSGNDMLRQVMHSMGGLTLRFRYMSITIPGQMELSADRHNHLLDVFRARDAQASEIAVRGIVAAAGDAVLAHFYDDHTAPVTRAVADL